MNSETDHILFEKIKRSDEKAFEALFRAYYPFLCLYATRMLKDAPAAEEIVQELFVRIWEKRTGIKIDISVKSYLFRAVKNKCLNHLRHLRVQEEYSLVVRTEQSDIMEQGLDTQAELMEKIETAIDALPEKRKEIFRLSRQEGLKYREIAEKLNISIKTVEAQMGLAIRHLREKLHEYLPLF